MIKVDLSSFLVLDFLVVQMVKCLPTDGRSCWDYSPWSHKELDMTERFHSTFLFFFQYLVDFGVKR